MKIEQDNKSSTLGRIKISGPTLRIFTDNWEGVMLHTHCDVDLR